MSEIAEALAAFADGRISRTQVWRQLLAYEDWMMPKNEGVDSFGPFTPALPKLIGSEDGRKQIFLFADADAQERFASTCEASRGVGFGNPTGWQVFSVTLVGVDEVVIDPGAPHEFVVASPEFAEIKELAAAVAIEEVWQRLRSGNEEEGDEALAALYPGYYLIMVQRPEGILLINVPNDDGTRCTPVFTHADALSCALDEIREQFAPAEIKMIRVGGAQMFPVLAKEETDGIVINFRGPGEPIAFGIGMTEIMLRALAASDKSGINS
jgi:SseB protein N-terminal domain